MNERQQAIINQIIEKKEVAVNDLAEALGVSGVTIRQDLTFLEEEGFIKRVHGGAVLNNTDDISTRLIFNYDKKLRIARKAAAFVNEGETILIEAGSTSALLAKEIAGKRGVTIVTVNVFIARELREQYDTPIILLGGLYQHQSESLVGKLTKLCLDHVNFHKAFIGIDGFAREAGFTGKDMMRAEINAYIAEKSPQVFVITDSSKFGKMELTTYFKATDVDYVITDAEIPAEDKAFLEQAGVTVVLADSA
jgi:DeoR/GlpR family transcriptional regulator of sugar metabolism